ncbi:MAG TPA: bifunctional 3,4-dihydroxy-2-butanone-4-phosphate synthase/GTP cyclohydrolase II, partial [Pseudomonadales bacterium]|nr:bifunctional 3,4-dihydroxy-2-butanone-4-phosphate synthase/GTP cyclohydrolase II [Pseudomonadales bacterium]
QFAARHELRIGTIADLIAYRALHDQTVARRQESTIDTAYGRMRLLSYVDLIDGSAHFALIRGEISADRPTLVRVHALDMLRDLFRVERPGVKRGWSLDSALQRIAAEEHGVLVLVSRNRNTAELLQQIESYPERPQPQGSSSEKGQRFWRMNGTGSQILKDIGVHRMRVMNSPTRYSAISGFNLEIVEFVENA